jgi:hypothetical protein
MDRRGQEENDTNYERSRHWSPSSGNANVSYHLIRRYLFCQVPDNSSTTYEDWRTNGKKFTTMIKRTMLSAIVLLIAAWLLDYALVSGQGHRPSFTVAKETTYITGPLDKDGYIDYEAALNKRLGEGIAPENNANILLWRALGTRPQGHALLPEFFEWQKTLAPPAGEVYFVGLAQYAKEKLKLQPGAAMNDLLRHRNLAAKGPWVDKDYPQVAAWIKANEKPLALVVEATRRSEFYDPLVSSKSGDFGWCGLAGALMPGMLECRELGPALAACAMRYAGEGKLEEARQYVLAAHRLGRLLSRRAEPTVYQIGLVIDQFASQAHLALLDRSNPSAPVARAWRRDLERLPPLPSVADWFDLGGRFMYLDSVLRVRRNGAKFLYFLIAFDPRIASKPRSPKTYPQLVLDDLLDWDAIMRAGNVWFDRIAAAHRLPDRAAREKEFDRIGDDLHGYERDGGALVSLTEALNNAKGSRQEMSKRLTDVLIGFYMQGFRQVRRAADRAQQDERSLRLALTLAAYRADHGRYPPNLDALAPDYLDMIPDDLFSGKTLIYRPSTTGYLLYSVGVNGLDEDGRQSNDTPPGDDLRVRMPISKRD